MDDVTAREQLEPLHHSSRAAARPPLPIAVRAVAALAAGGGVALLGQPADSGVTRLAVRLVAVALLTAAFGLQDAYRRRRGLYGYQGRVRSDNLAFGICALALLVTGVNATTALGWIYTGLGVVAAGGYFLTLSGRLDAER